MKYVVRIQCLIILTGIKVTHNGWIALILVGNVRKAQNDNVAGHLYDIKPNSNEKNP